MRSVMIQEDIKLVEERIKSFELNTSCELLLVVTDASDPYPAAPWRFSFIATFVTSLVFAHYFEFHDPHLWAFFFLTVGLIFLWLGHFDFIKRFCLAKAEVERECAEKAIQLFHSLGTSQVEHKVTAMIMVSILEHEIEVLVDEKLKTKLSEQDLNHLIHLMQNHFRKGHMALGLIESIASLESKILAAFGGRVSEVNATELKDKINFVSL
jgi:putative membrane protein